MKEEYINFYKSNPTTSYMPRIVDLREEEKLRDKLYDLIQPKIQKLFGGDTRVIRNGWTLEICPKNYYDSVGKRVYLSVDSHKIRFEEKAKLEDAKRVAEVYEKYSGKECAILNN